MFLYKNKRHKIRSLRARMRRIREVVSVLDYQRQQKSVLTSAIWIRTQAPLTQRRSWNFTFEGVAKSQGCSWSPKCLHR